MNAEIINGFETKNIDKATYLLLKGATYRGVKIDGKIGNFVIDNVPRKHLEDFHQDTLMVEYWTFKRMRTQLINRVTQKINGINSQKT